MKLVIISCNEAVGEEVMELLSDNGVEGYTLWTKVLGKGQSSGPHLMSHVWPKANNILMVGVEGGVAQSLLSGVRKLRESIGHEGVKAFVVPLEEVT